MPSVVVDTNILVRALLSPDGSDVAIFILAGSIAGITILTPQEFLKGMPVGTKKR